MRAGWWAAGLGIVLTVAWGCLGWLATRPATDRQYRGTAGEVARTGYDTVATTDRVVRAWLDGRLYHPYLVTMVDTERRQLAGAMKRLADNTPPDAAAVSVQSQLSPLLSSADVALGTVQQAVDADDTPALTAAAARLPPLADQLSALAERYR